MKKVITLDFTECCYLGEVHEVIRRELELPEWFGANPDALWDALTGIVPRRNPDPPPGPPLGAASGNRENHCRFSGGGTDVPGNLGRGSVIPSIHTQKQPLPG